MEWIAGFLGYLRSEISDFKCTRINIRDLRFEIQKPNLDDRRCFDESLMTDLTEPIPIAFCITELDRGGAERALSQLVLGLDRRSWLPRVYCLGPRGYFAGELESGGVDVQCFGANGLRSFPSVVWRLKRELRSFRPQILQTFLFHGNLVGRIAARLAGVPIVVSGIRVAERRSRWYGRLDRWTNGLVNLNVCVSQGVADFSIRETGLKPSKLTVIPNGVDFETFANAAAADLRPLGIRSSGPVVITVGRLEEQKGIEFLLWAAALVLNRIPGCQFLIVGDGPDRDSLQALASALEIADSVFFAGHRGDVPELLKASSVFALASLWEGMPNALLEAMAAGLPVVATSVEGSSEVVESGVSGLLVEPRDVQGLAEALLRLLLNPEDATALANAAQHIAAEMFAKSRVVSAYDQLYRLLLVRA